jgi:hypothetical protein
VFIVLSTTGRRFAPGFGGLTAGITLAVIHLVTIPVDNTSVNPVRSLATAIFADTDPSGPRPAVGVHHLPAHRLGRRSCSSWLLVDESTLSRRCSTPTCCAGPRDASTTSSTRARRRTRLVPRATKPGP